MKAVSESTWTFQIIIFFILIFACFLVLVLSYNKAYTIKNRTLSIIEKYEGITPTSAELLNDYISNKGYTNKGKCPDGWMGAINLQGDFELAKTNNTYYYCFKEESKNNKVYYDIKVFYKFNLPIIGDIMNYQIDGTTKTFLGADDRIKEQ